MLFYLLQAFNYVHTYLLVYIDRYTCTEKCQYLERCESIFLEFP